MKMSANLLVLTLGLILALAQTSHQSPTGSAFEKDSNTNPHVIELGMIIDQHLYQQFNQSDDLLNQYCLDLVQEANAIIRQINMTIQLVDVSIWKTRNEIQITNDTIATLNNLLNSTKNDLPVDTVIVLSGFRDLHLASAAYLRSICRQPASGAVIRVDAVQAKQDALAVVHEIGHLLGAGHDHQCRGCVMSPFSDDSSDGRWSEGSVRELFAYRESGLWSCLTEQSAKFDGDEGCVNCKTFPRLG